GAGWVPVDHLTRLWRDIEGIEAAYACRVALLVSPITGDFSFSFLAPCMILFYADLFFLEAKEKAKILQSVVDVDFSTLLSD
ncbi:MAG: hypothetical protein AAFR59_18155, partial [Bacteroidota bacterium]